MKKPFQVLNSADNEDKKVVQFLNLFFFCLSFYNFKMQIKGVNELSESRSAIYEKKLKSFLGNQKNWVVF